MQSVLRSYSFPHYGWRRRDSRRREISPANPHRGGTAPASHLNQHPWWGDPQCHLVSVSFCSAISLGFFRSVLELRAIIINDTFFVTDQAASSQILSLPCLVTLLNKPEHWKTQFQMWKCPTLHPNSPYWGLTPQCEEINMLASLHWDNLLVPACGDSPWLRMVSTTRATAPPPEIPTCGWWTWSQLVPLSEVTTQRGSTWRDGVVLGPPPNPLEPSSWPADVLEECDVSQVWHQIPSLSHVLPTKSNPSQKSIQVPILLPQCLQRFKAGPISLKVELSAVRWELRSWSIRYREKLFRGLEEFVLLSTGLLYIIL